MNVEDLKTSDYKMQKKKKTNRITKPIIVYTINLIKSIPSIYIN